MNLQLLVSAMHADPTILFEKMHISTDAIVINQCDTYTYNEYSYAGKKIRFFSMKEKGVGLSRNTALLRADHTISLFSDDDIEYYPDYEEKVLGAFKAHPEADILLFNFCVSKERQTYYTKSFHKVSWYNSGRYPTYSIAIRTDKMHAHTLSFSLLFGGGAKYSNGEDSLFLRDCIKNGLQVYAIPIELGAEDTTPSTWFQGYNEKFFIDRGVLYSFLYGKWAMVFALRFLIKHKKTLCQTVPLSLANRYIQSGIHMGKIEKSGTI